MGRFKVNRVSVDIQNYLYYIRGIKKSGKTTLFRDLILELFGTPEKGLLIACKDEVGYTALDNIQPEHVETWDEFEKLVKDLVENKEEYGIEFLGIDTVDELVDMAIQKAMKLSTKETGKVCKSINSAFGGFGAGRQRVTQMIKEQLALLKKAGYGLMAIGHTKLRTVKEKGMENDEGYQQLTSNLSSDYDGIFADVFDVVATINVAKTVEEGKLAGTTRYLYFRDDGFIDCGSRFKNMPEKIALEDDNLAKGFISAIKEGIKNSMTSPITDAEIEKRRKEEIAERERKAKEFVEAVKQPTNEELVNAIKAKYSTATDEQKTKFTELMKENEVPSLKEPDEIDIEVLKLLLEVFNQ
jgi:hypothetical protein